MKTLTLWWEADENLNPTNTPEELLDCDTLRWGAKHIAYTKGGKVCSIGTHVIMPDGKKWFGTFIKKENSKSS